jgi:hypothetical protein
MGCDTVQLGEMSDCKIQELCRKHGISDSTFYKWRAKMCRLEVNDVKKLQFRRMFDSKTSPHSVLAKA